MLDMNKMHIDITEGEREALRSIMQSEGWNALKRLWDQQWQFISLKCMTDREDNRFNQGFAAGFDFAEQMAVAFSRKDETPAMPPVASELNLMARTVRKR